MQQYRLVKGLKIKIEKNFLCQIFSLMCGYNKAIDILLIIQHHSKESPKQTLSRNDMILHNKVVHFTLTYFYQHSGIKTYLSKTRHCLVVPSHCQDWRDFTEPDEANEW